MTAYQVHDLVSFSMSDAYDLTQISSNIKSGDVLIVQDGFAVLLDAWPVMVEGSSKVFHRLEDGYSFEQLYIDEGKDLLEQVKEIRFNKQQLVQRAVQVAEIDLI